MIHNLTINEDKTLDFDFVTEFAKVHCHLTINKNIKCSNLIILGCRYDDIYDTHERGASIMNEKIQELCNNNKWTLL